MRKIFIVIIILVLDIAISLAQVNKSVYGEFGGPGMGVTVNFDCRLFTPVHLGPGVRVGIGMGQDMNLYTGFPTAEETDFFISCPVGIDWVFGFKKPHNTVEVGLGVVGFSRPVYYFNHPDAEKRDRMVGFIATNYKTVPVGDFFFKAGFSVAIGRHRVVPFVNYGFGYYIRKY